MSPPAPTCTESKSGCEIAAQYTLQMCRVEKALNARPVAACSVRSVLSETLSMSQRKEKKSSLVVRVPTHKHLPAPTWRAMQPISFETAGYINHAIMAAHVLSGLLHDHPQMWYGNAVKVLCVRVCVFLKEV
jgi:hypothetical protein